MKLFLNTHLSSGEEGEHLFLSAMKRNFLPTLNVLMNKDYFIFHFPDPSSLPCVLPLTEELKENHDSPEGKVFHLSTDGMSGDDDSLRRFYYPRLESVELRRSIDKTKYHLLHAYTNLLEGNEFAPLDSIKGVVKYDFEEMLEASKFADDLRKKMEKFKSYADHHLDGMKTFHDLKSLHSIYVTLEEYVAWSQHRYPLI